MMARAGRQMQMAVRVLSALALLVLSFAHQPVSARQIAPALVAEYTLPDGSVGDICFGLDGVEGKGVEGKGHGTSHAGVEPVCEYCRLTASTILPPPPDESTIVIRSEPPFSIRPDFEPFSVAYPRALPPSRAPPVLL